MALKKMTFLILIIFIPVMFFFKCSSFDLKDTFSSKSKYYSDAELSILEETLNELEYGFGYDYQIELNYIYSYSFSKDNFDKKEKAFAEIIDKADFKTVIDLYEKILKIQAMTDYKLDKYKKESKWKYYTFIKNDLAGPLNSYSSLLLKYILKKNSAMEQILAMKRESIGIQVVKENAIKDEIVDTF